MSRYYVYELIDPRDQAVFYVGKGQGNRYARHEIEAIKGKRSRKCDLIRAIIADGLSYTHRIHMRTSIERLALDAEKALIARHGLENLTNVLPSGYVGPPVSDKGKEARRYVEKNAEKMMWFARRLCGTHTFTLGDYDITEACFAAMKAMRTMAGADHFDKHVPLFSYVEEYRVGV